MYETGVVYLVGSGGGDPWLITSRAKEVLARADVVVYDTSLSSDFLEIVPSDCERIEVTDQSVDEKSSPTKNGEFLVSRAEEAKTVVRLYPDDPYNSGLCIEDAQILTRQGIPFEVIPGLSAELAAPTFAGIPLREGKGSSGYSILEYASGFKETFRNSPYCALAKEGSTLVFTLETQEIDSLVSDLVAGDVPGSSPLAIVINGGSAAQRVIETTLESTSFAKEKGRVEGKVVMVLGEVNRLRWELNWFEGRPLHGRRILVTRPQEQSDEFARLLEEVGAEPLIAPTIRITPPEDWGPVDRAIRRLETYDWVIFTSANGVRFFADRLIENGRDSRAFSPQSQFVAIGPATARALEEYLRIRADAVPERYVAEGVLEMFSGDAISDKRILIPRAEVAREILPEELRNMGADVDLVSAYRTLPMDKPKVERLRKDLKNGCLDMVTFTSSSTVRNFVELLGENHLREAMKQVAVASIGPITSETARELGLNPHVEAEVSTTRGLARAIVDFYRFSPAVDWQNPVPWVGEQ